MKIQLITAAAILTLSAGAFAAPVTLSGSTSMTTANYQSAEQAMNAGHDMAEQVKQLDQQKKAFKLGLSGHSLIHNSVGIDSAEVKVEQVSPERGVVEYRAVVSLDYHYSENEHS